MTKERDILMIILCICALMATYVLYILFGDGYNDWMESFAIPATLGDEITNPLEHSTIEIDGYKYYNTGKSVTQGKIDRNKPDGVIKFEDENWGECKYWNSNYIKVDTPDGLVGYRGYKVVDIKTYKYCIDELPKLSNETYQWILDHQNMTESEWELLNIPEEIDNLSTSIIWNLKEYDRRYLSADTIAWLAWWEDLSLENRTSNKLEVPYELR